jgi:hypothetical protein
VSTFWGTLWNNSITDAILNGLSSAQQSLAQFNTNAAQLKQFYAQQANQAFQSGGALGWVGASGWDALGGITQLATGGTPVSPGQALWSVWFSLPVMGESMAAHTIGLAQSAFGTTSAIASIGGTEHMTMGQWLTGMAGQLGGFLGVRGSAYSDIGNSLGALATQAKGTAQLALANAAAQVSSVAGKFTGAGNLLNVGSFLSSAGDTLSHAFAPQVGGVLFDQCETVLTGIEEIVGAYWDKASQSVVLIGKPNAGGNLQRLRIPGLDNDHLKVALKAAIAGLPLGVSIDPPANYRYGANSNEMMPEGSPLVVSYLGDTAGTLYGAIMFESDRIMKCLSVGLENRTRQPFGSRVRGYRDLFGEARNSAAGQSWHRFWFVIDHVKLSKSEHDNGVVVDGVGIKVLTELELAHSPKGQAIDPDDRAFADHLTNNYDAYAAEFPVLARLKELAKISAIARFLVAQNVPLDLGSLFQVPPTWVATPETTPSILRTASTENHTRQMSGGVDLDADPVIVPDQEDKTEHLIRAASAARKPGATIWLVPAGVRTLQARSIPLTSPAFRRIVTEHRFADSQGAHSLELRRIYDSSRGSEGDFGLGWSVFLPYSMIALRRSGKKVEVLSDEEKEKDTSETLPSLLIVRDNATGATELYRPTRAQGAPLTEYGRVTSQTVTKGSISFKYDADDVIALKRSRLHLFRQGADHVFDLEGHLVEVHADQRSVLKVSYAEGRIAGLTNEAGQGYEFVRGPEGGRAVTRVEMRGAGAEGRITFAYDETGRLKQAGGTSLAKQRYCYGLNGELAEIRDSTRNNCETVASGVADIADDVVQLAFGNSIRRKWEGGRLSSIEDDQGSRADIIYSGNVLKQINIRGRGGTIRKFDFDTDGYLRFTRGSSSGVKDPAAPARPSTQPLAPSEKIKGSVKTKTSRNPVSLTAGPADSLVIEFA